ncbi:hypothetical protein D3C86_2026880 [compost metagenome]
MKNRLTHSPIQVIQSVVLPFNLLENNAQSGGASNGPPEIAEMLSTTSTMPPAAGTSNAMPIIPKPKNHDEPRATRMSCLSEAAGLTMPL